MTLLEYYGPMFEVLHPEGCTCPSPQELEFERWESCGVIMVRVSNRCAFCGLEVHGRWRKLIE